MPDERVTVFVRGHVQGVGFRWWARARALELGLVGYARNLDDGRVEVLAQGPTEAIDAMVRLLSGMPSRRAAAARPLAPSTWAPDPAEATTRHTLTW